jgi:hypothetical protein
MKQIKIRLKFDDFKSIINDKFGEGNSMKIFFIYYKPISTWANSINLRPSSRTSFSPTTKHWEKNLSKPLSVSETKDQMNLWPLSLESSKVKFINQLTRVFPSLSSFIYLGQYPTELRNFSASQIRLCLSNFSPSTYTNVWTKLTAQLQELIKVKLFEIIYK